jgi:putative ABC transport system permease protein
VSGGIVGVAVSLGLTGLTHEMFYSVDYAGRALYVDFSPAPLVILTVLAASAGAGLLFGLMPALLMTRMRVLESLGRSASIGGTPPRWANWLIGAQAACAVALAAVAGLLMASAQSVVTGINFDSSHVALMRLRPRLIGYPPDKAQAFQRSVVRRLRALPGVESVSLVGTGAVLLGGEQNVSLPEWSDRDRQPLRSGYLEIGSRYLETLGTPLLRGREFDDRDGLGSPLVALVNETLARRLWPTGDVIGATLLVGDRRHQVVGIVADVPLESRAQPRKPYVYAPYWQNAMQVDARYCVRVKGDPAAMLSLLVREVNRVDPDVPVSNTTTLPVQIKGTIKPTRITATLLAYAAGLSVLLSAIGLYGTLAFSVSRRTREIGIRMAVGAESRTVRSMVVREGMAVVALGIVGGMGLAVGGARVVRHLLYGSAADGAFYAAAAVLMLGVGLVACWIPAGRAASVEPAAALRAE